MLTGSTVHSGHFYGATISEQVLSMGQTYKCPILNAYSAKRTARVFLSGPVQMDHICEGSMPSFSLYPTLSLAFSFSPSQ